MIRLWKEIFPVFSWENQMLREKSCMGEDEDCSGHSSSLYLLQESEQGQSS